LVFDLKILLYSLQNLIFQKVNERGLVLVERVVLDVVDYDTRVDLLHKFFIIVAWDEEVFFEIFVVVEIDFLRVDFVVQEVVVVAILF